MEKFGAKYGVEKFFADESLVRLAHGEYPQEAWEKRYFTRFMKRKVKNSSKRFFSAGNNHSSELIRD